MDSLKGRGLLQCLGTEVVDYLEPSCVEEELEEGEDGNVQVQVVSRVAFGGIQELPSDQACKEERVDGESDDLGQRRQGESTVLASTGAKCVGGKTKTKQTNPAPPNPRMHGPGAMAQSIKCLQHQREDLSSSPSTLVK